MFERFLKVALRAAERAGALLMRHHREPKHVMRKSERNDLVTHLDRESETLIARALRRAFPDHDIVGEEFKRPLIGSPYRWYIDPLDGTVNYVHSLPFFSISVGLVLRGRPICGVVFVPALREMFTGALGRGAFRNGKRMRVSRQSDLRDAFLVTGFPYSMPGRRKQLRDFSRFIMISQGVRRLGSAAIDFCYVADGIFDGFWENGLHPWDMAAGAAILLEAGGRITDLRGGPCDLEAGNVVASNGRVHRAMLKVIRQPEREPFRKR